MESLNFRINDNKEYVEKLLKNKGFKKIGHIKKEIVGFHVLIKRKKFFEISSIINPNIIEIHNLNDLALFTNNKQL